MTVRKGEPWGAPTAAPADLEVRGDDAALAALLPDHLGALVRFQPTRSDFAKAVGLAADAAPSDIGAADAAPSGIALPIDAIAVDGTYAMNMVVLGTAPGRVRATSRSHRLRVVVDDREVFAGRATTVVIANGQFLDDGDIVPRGHPGDGRLEVQVYALAPRERRGMRARLPSGTHLPHPRITTTSGRTIRVESSGGTGRGGVAVAYDGHPIGRRSTVDAAVVPGALRLLA